MTNSTVWLVDQPEQLQRHRGLLVALEVQVGPQVVVVVLPFQEEVVVRVDQAAEDLQEEEEVVARPS